MKEHIYRRSLAAGYRHSILPEFTYFESEYLKGTVDFFGVNIYSALLATPIKQSTNSLVWNEAMEVQTYHASNWEATESNLFKVLSFSFSQNGNAYLCRKNKVLSPSKKLQPLSDCPWYQGERTKAQLYF